jgi:hypothetical protein
MVAAKVAKLYKILVSVGLYHSVSSGWGGSCGFRAKKIILRFETPEIIGGLLEVIIFEFRPDKLSPQFQRAIAFGANPGEWGKNNISEITPQNQRPFDYIKL